MRSLASPPYTRVETGDLFVTQEQLYKLKKVLRVVPASRSSGPVGQRACP
jgi:hypothetical protein